MNQVSILGRLVRDPERFSTKDGGHVVTFTLAFTESKSSVYVPVLSFGKVGEAVYKYLKKGSQVAVSGRLTTRRIEFKDGVRHSLEVITDRVDFLNTGPKEDANDIAIDAELPF